MVNVDEHTSNAIEIISEGAKITEQTLLYIMKALVKFLEDENGKDAIISDSTKEGKQKINDLIKKHQSNVYALDENLTKEQLKDYEREFKKLGVDFSVTKNGEDSYSFFFAGQQANVIEKALKNVSELKSAVLENKDVKKSEKELTDIKSELPKETVEKVKSLYDSLTEKEQEIKSLNPEEKFLFDKYKSVDKLKIETKEKIVNTLDKSFGEKNNDINKEKLIGKQQTNFNSANEQLSYIFNQLNDDERKLFTQLNNKNVEALDNAFASAGYTNHKEKNTYEQMKVDYPKEIVNKVEMLYDTHIYSGNGNVPKNKVHMDTLKGSKPELNKSKENDKKFSINAVKSIDKEIKNSEKDGHDKNRKQELSR